MRSDVTSEQMAVKLGMLMQDQLLIPKIFKSHFGQKFELLCFGFVRQPGFGRVRSGLDRVVEFSYKGVGC